MTKLEVATKVSTRCAGRKLVRRALFAEIMETFGGRLENSLRRRTHNPEMIGHLSRSA